jgi:hypothetical protein
MRRLLVMFALCATAILALAPAALAQNTPQQDAEEDVFDCADFATRTGAQALFESGDPSKLDADGDGEACEAKPGGSAEDGTTLGAKTRGDVDCIDFPSQKAAQAGLKAKPSDSNKLDVDNDGIACQVVPVQYKDAARDKTPVAEARSSADLSCDDFEYQQEAQMIFLRDESDPNNLDEDGNNLVCENLPALESNQESIRTQVQTVPSPQPLAQALPFIGLLAVGSGTLGFATWRRSRSQAG